MEDAAHNGADQPQQLPDSGPNELDDDAHAPGGREDAQGGEELRAGDSPRRDALHEEAGRGQEAQTAPSGARGSHGAEERPDSLAELNEALEEDGGEERGRGELSPGEEGVEDEVEDASASPVRSSGSALHLAASHDVAALQRRVVDLEAQLALREEEMLLQTRELTLQAQRHVKVRGRGRGGEAGSR
jgi:hypothetical protein